MSHSYIQLPDTPNIPGLRFRMFAGEGDYPAMAAMINALAEHEGSTAMCNVRALCDGDQWIDSFDPARDRVMIEIDGRLIGAGRVESAREPDGKRLYLHSCNILPSWRGKGIEQAMLRHNEQRLRELASAHPPDRLRVFQAHGFHDSNRELAAVLEAAGYSLIRCAYLMIRPDLIDIPEAPLPQGVEIRPIVEAHLRTIWDMHVEAFQDHWGFVPPGKNAFEIWRDDPNWDRALSSVAWDGDQVVGMVLIFIPRDHNAKHARQRAFTESICVRRRWRKKGVASALIARCLHALRDAGYHEASLGVDADNISGALRIYEKMGYRVQQRYVRYEKGFD